MVHIIKCLSKIYEYPQAVFIVIRCLPDILYHIQDCHESGVATSETLVFNWDKVSLWSLILFCLFLFVYFFLLFYLSLVSFTFPVWSFFRDSLALAMKFEQYLFNLQLGFLAFCFVGARKVQNIPTHCPPLFRSDIADVFLVKPNVLIQGKIEAFKASGEIVKKGDVMGLDFQPLLRVEKRSNWCLIDRTNP